MSNGSDERNRGMQAAIAHANRVHNDPRPWSEQAFDFLKVFLSHKKGPFMAEEFRQLASHAIPEPPHARAFGGVILRAKSEKLIRKVGVRSVTNPKAHLAMATVWQRV